MLLIFVLQTANFSCESPPNSSENFFLVLFWISYIFSLTIWPTWYFSSFKYPLVGVTFWWRPDIPSVSDLTKNSKILFLLSLFATLHHECKTSVYQIGASSTINIFECFYNFEFKLWQHFATFSHLDQNLLYVYIQQILTQLIILYFWISTHSLHAVLQYLRNLLGYSRLEQDILLFIINW